MYSGVVATAGPLGVAQLTRRTLSSMLYVWSGARRHVNDSVSLRQYSRGCSARRASRVHDGGEPFQGCGLSRERGNNRGRAEHHRNSGGRQQRQSPKTPTRPDRDRSRHSFQALWGHQFRASGESELPPVAWRPNQERFGRGWNHEASL